ncbi:MAG: hypothetical protein CMC97_06660, partial [Flavobacteriales bacterium]|nr:hypothetical protein [Flavobacteriales bacterium]
MPRRGWAATLGVGLSGPCTGPPRDGGPGCWRSGWHAGSVQQGSGPPSRFPSSCWGWASHGCCSPWPYRFGCAGFLLAYCC